MDGRDAPVIDECLVVEFGVAGDDCPLADATRVVDASVDARPPQLRDDGNALLQFSAPDDGHESGTQPTADAPADPTDDPLAVALDADDRILYLHRARMEGRANYRCLSKHPCVVHELVSAGLLVESITYRGGDATVVGAVVGYDVLEGVMNRAGDTVGVSLRRVHPLGTDDDSPVAQRWNLTAKQEAAIRAAFEAGYFDVPRGTDAAAVAADLGLSKSAFVERVRRGERALLAQVLG